MTPKLENNRPERPFDDFNCVMTPSTGTPGTPMNDVEITHSNMQPHFSGNNGLDETMPSASNLIDINLPSLFILRHPDLNSRISVKELQNFVELQDEHDSGSATVYKINAKMMNYLFTYNNVSVLNLGILRRHFLALNCYTVHCRFSASYEHFTSHVASSIAHTSSKMPECPRCHNTLRTHLRISLEFVDQDKTRLKILFMSPLVESSINCQQTQLMFSSPNDRSIVKALDFILQTICPFKNNSDNSFEVTEAAAEQNPVHSIYFRKFPLSAPPSNDMNPNPELFSEFPGEPFVFELIGIEEAPRP